MKDFELNLKTVMIKYNNMLLLALFNQLLNYSISDFIKIKTKEMWQATDDKKLEKCL